uniref:Uncharacterized protein n=1 Tax=viral metagenome TaxID=1070528 RepID=A0A6M3IZZ8_9ZZZZ
MPIEPVFWHKGLAFHVRSALQEPGFLKTAENITFRTEGKQELRPSFSAVNSTSVNAIHSIKRFLNNIIIGDDTNLRDRSALTSGNFTTLGVNFANAIWSFIEYKNFLNAVNGTDNVLIDSDGNAYNGAIANPSGIPAGAAGAAGNPNDTYALYVTYLITWPNGHTYETGFSLSSDVTVATQKISWTNIPVCPYTAIYGTQPTIHRKLYRGPGTGGTLADIYLVTTITDNTTTTYTDDVSDSQLAANGASTCENYTTGPTKPLYGAINYGRFFYIDADYLNRLYYSEAVAGATAGENETLMPLAFQTNNWDDIRVAGYGRCDPQGLVTWGTYLYIPMKHTWIKKYGNDPDTWSYKKTWANIGIAAPYSIAKAVNPAGILGISNPIGGSPGISLFNGQVSQILANQQLTEIFEDDLNHDYIHKCRGVWDGRYYHVLYPSGSNTEPDKWLAVDLVKAPELRVAFWMDLNARSIDIYDQGSQVYVGGYDGYVRQNSGTESRNIQVETHDLIGGKVEIANTLKTLKELKYNIDTGTKQVSLEIIIDGENATWPDGTTSCLINGTGDKIQVKRGFPTNFRGYKFSFRITGTGLSTMNLYSPWQVDFDVTM